MVFLGNCSVILGKNCGILGIYNSILIKYSNTLGKNIGILVKYRGILEKYDSIFCLLAN